MPDCSMVSMPTTPREAGSAGFELPPRICLVAPSASRELRASPSSSGSHGAPARGDDAKHGKRATPRQWTEEEHALFLHGLELGLRGRWAKLAHEVLLDGRTPAQVASHAQKYFLKLEAARGKSRRVCAAPEPALLRAMELLADEEQEQACCSPDAAPACSSDSAGTSCRPETPQRAATSVFPATTPAPLPPAAAAPAPAPLLPISRLMAEAFAEQLQRALLGGVTMTRDECSAVATLEGLLQRAHAPQPASRHRRASCA